MVELKTQTKKVNLKQLAEEAGVDVSKIGGRTKGKDMWFFSDTLTKADADKIKLALESHVPEIQSKYNIADEISLLKASIDEIKSSISIAK